MNGLPAQYRDPLILHFLQGLTYQETARQLGVTIGTVEGRIKRGKRELHLRLNKRGVGLVTTLAAISWSQTAAAAALQPQFIQSLTASGLSALQGTTFPAACSPEAVYLAGKDITMLTSTKAALLTCGLILAGGTGWMAHAGFATDASQTGTGAVGTVVQNSDDEGDSATDSAEEGFLAQDDAFEGDSGGLSGGGFGLEAGAGSGQSQEGGGDGGFGLFGGESGAGGGGFGFGLEGSGGGNGVAAPVQSGTNRYTPITDSERELHRQAILALTELHNRIQNRKRSRMPFHAQSSPLDLDNALANINQSIQTLTAASQNYSRATPGTAAAQAGADAPMMGGGMGMSVPGGSAKSTPEESPRRELVLRNNSEQEERILTALNQLTKFEFPGNPLSDIMEFISVTNNIPILVDEVALSDNGIATDVEVELVVSEITLDSALNLLLNPLDLDYVISDDVLQITTKDVAKTVMETRVYDVRSMNIENPEALADVIVYGTAGPWASRDSEGGEISFLNGSVVIRQTRRTHEEVEKLLKNLTAIEQAYKSSPQWPAKNRIQGGMGGGYEAGGYDGEGGYGMMDTGVQIPIRGSWDHIPPKGSLEGMYGADSGGYDDASSYGAGAGFPGGGSGVGGGYDGTGPGDSGDEGDAFGGLDGGNTSGHSVGGATFAGDGN